MAWREEAHLGDVYIEGAVDLREGPNAAAAQGGFGVGVKAKLAAGTVTIATLGVAVENNSEWTLHGSTGAVLEDKGMTVNTTLDRIVMDFIGTKYCRIEGKFSLDIANAADLIVIQIRKNNTTVLFESAAQSVTSGTPLLFACDFYDTLVNADYVNLWVENQDTADNITVAAYVEASGVVAAGAAVGESGYLQITGA